MPGPRFSSFGFFSAYFLLRDEGTAGRRVLGSRRSVPLAPLREKKWHTGRAATQAIAGSRVNVTDPCATFFGKVAHGSVASGRGTAISSTNFRSSTANFAH